MTALLDHLLATPLLAIALTLAAHAAGARLLQALGAPAWCPSILAAALLLAGTLALLSIDYADYRQGAAWLMLLLGPATVALGLPLHQQMPRIVALWRPLLACLPVAVALAAAYAVGIAWWLGLRRRSSPRWRPSRSPRPSRWASTPRSAARSR